MSFDVRTSVSIPSEDAQKLENLDDLSALFKIALGKFVGRPYTEDTKQQMYATCLALACAVMRVGLLRDGSAVQFQLDHDLLEPGTELVFEFSEEHVLRVWLRGKGGGAFIRLIFRAPIPDSVKGPEHDQDPE
jgi:hypothetical protein